MSSACSAEKAWAGLVSMAPAMNMLMLSWASRSEVWVSSQRLNEISSSSAARGCAHGRSGSISATRASSLSIRVTSSCSVVADTGKISPWKRLTSPLALM